MNTDTVEGPNRPMYYATVGKSNQTMSDEVNKLAEALSKAQGQMENAIKDSENPYFRSRYADLASVWEAARKPLSANGLAVTQTSEFNLEAVTVVTTLLHSSGQWLRGTLAMKPVKNDPQGIGSCLTYSRRYALAAILGIAQADDDGNEASRPSKPLQGMDKPPVTMPKLKQPESLAMPEPEKAIENPGKVLEAVVADEAENEATLPLWNVAITPVKNSNGGKAWKINLETGVQLLTKDEKLKKMIEDGRAAGATAKLSWQGEPKVLVDVVPA